VACIEPVFVGCTYREMQADLEKQLSVFTPSRRKAVRRQALRLISEAQGLKNAADQLVPRPLQQKSTRRKTPSEHSLRQLRRWPPCSVCRMRFGLPKRSFPTLAPQVGVDDIRFYRGGDGIWTHIVDLHTGETIDLLPGTSGALLQFFLGGLRDTSALTSYCSDGAIQYIQIGRHNFPYATRTLNRFHVVRYLLEGLDAVRADVRMKSGDSEPIQILLLQDRNDALEEN
jgi:transposase